MENKISGPDPSVCKFTWMLSIARVHMFAAWIIAGAIRQDEEDGNFNRIRWSALGGILQQPRFTLLLNRFCLSGSGTSYASVPLIRRGSQGCHRCRNNQMFHIKHREPVLCFDSSLSQAYLDCRSQMMSAACIKKTECTGQRGVIGTAYDGREICTVTGLQVRKRVRKKGESVTVSTC